MHSLGTRLAQFYVLFLLAMLPLAGAFAWHGLQGVGNIYLIMRLVCILLYLTILFSRVVIPVLRSRFPALSSMTVRLTFVSLLFFSAGSSEALPGSEWYYFGAGLILIAIIVFAAAQLSVLKRN